MAGQPTRLGTLAKRASLAALCLLSVARWAAAEQACATLRGQAERERHRERLEAGEILVTLEPQPEFKIKKGVALARVAAPAEQVFEVVTDHEGFVRFLPYVAEAEVRKNETGVVVYQLLDLPFPLRSRHYEVRVERSSEPTRCFESRWHYVPGSGNIDDTFGRWEVLADGDGATLLAYVVWVDPGGLIPAWAYNWASRRALPRILSSVRHEAERRRAAASTGGAP